MSIGIVIFTENPYGILISDTAVADGYKKQFELNLQVGSNLKLPKPIYKSFDYKSLSLCNVNFWN